MNSITNFQKKERVIYKQIVELCQKDYKIQYRTVLFNIEQLFLEKLNNDKNFLCETEISVLWGCNVQYIQD